MPSGLGRSPSHDLSVPLLRPGARALLGIAWTPRAGKNTQTDCPTLWTARRHPQSFRTIGLITLSDALESSRILAATLNGVPDKLVCGSSEQDERHTGQKFQRLSSCPMPVKACVSCFVNCDNTFRIYTDFC